MSAELPNCSNYEYQGGSAALRAGDPDVRWWAEPLDGSRQRYTQFLDDQLPPQEPQLGGAAGLIRAWLADPSEDERSERDHPRDPTALVWSGPSPCGLTRAWPSRCSRLSGSRPPQSAGHSSLSAKEGADAREPGLWVVEVSHVRRVGNLGECACRERGMQLPGEADRECHLTAALHNQDRSGPAS